MGVISSRIRRHRRTRLAAEMACTWNPRRLFPLGQEQGGVYYPDDPNSLLRRRNRLTYSSQFSNAAWTKTNILSVTADADGVGDLVVPNTTSSSHNISQAGVAYSTGNVMRVRAKAGGYNFVAIRIGLNAYAHFNVSAGTVGTLSGATGEIAAAADAPGYYDCTCMTTSAVAGANALIYVAAADGVLTFAGDGTSGVYLARAQLEWNTTTASAYQEVTDWTDDYMAAVGHLVTQFQDSAGTTPVTKVTDPVGLTLDRRFGGYRGPQLLTSGAIGLTGTATAATYSTSTGAGTVTRVDASNQSWVQFSGLTAGRSYQIAVSGVSGGTLQVRDGSATGTVIASTTSATPCLVTATGTTITLTASAAATVAFMVTQIQWLPGNHRIQATSGSRKTLSARVNLLTKSEQFDDAAWLKTDTTITADNTTAPNGTTTADLLAEGTAGTGVAHQGATSTASAVYRARRVIKRGNHDWVMVGLADNTFANGVRQWINLATGAKGTQNTFGAGGATFSSCTVEDLGGGWYAVNLAGQIGATTVFRTYTHSAASDGSATRVNNGTRYEWGADLRTADDAAKAIPAYQRVNTATDYDTDGFPHFWLYDGTDDSDATAATVDGSASYKVTVIAGVTKNSDAAIGMFMEHTTSSASAGSFYFAAPYSVAANYGCGSRGTGSGAASTAASYASPHSAVATTQGDIAGDLLTLRLNGVQVASSANDEGTGNYANATQYWGRRAGTSLPFNGREYATIERFGPKSDGERNQAERWVAQRMGVTI